MRNIFSLLLSLIILSSCKKNESAPPAFEGSLIVNIDGGNAVLANVTATKESGSYTDKYTVAGSSGSEILNVQFTLPVTEPVVGSYPTATKTAELIILKHISGTDYTTFTSTKILQPDNVSVKIISFADGVLKGEFSGKLANNEGVTRVLTAGAFEAKIQ